MNRTQYHRIYATAKANRYTSDVRVAATARTCWIPVCECIMITMPAKASARDNIRATNLALLSNLGVLKTGGRQVQFVVGVATEGTSPTTQIN